MPTGFNTLKDLETTLETTPQDCVTNLIYFLSLRTKLPITSVIQRWERFHLNEALSAQQQCTHLAIVLILVSVGNMLNYIFIPSQNVDGWLNGWINVDKHTKYLQNIF